MLPLLPFVAGLVAGAAAVKLWRNEKTAQTLTNAKVKIRSATVSGLSRLESSSASMREKLAVGEAAPDPADDADVPAARPTRARKPRPAGSAGGEADAASGEPT
ncbi:MAG: hypothetical protein PHD19_13215 [Dechloromonas sp.]|nr:hypothetical protein [Dechloromonas sp.]